MFVVEWRAIRSGLSGGLIRLAGFFVIFALLGMFIQMVTVAYPIWRRARLPRQHRALYSMPPVLVSQARLKTRRVPRIRVARIKVSYLPPLEVGSFKVTRVHLGSGFTS